MLPITERHPYAPLSDPVIMICYETRQVGDRGRIDNVWSWWDLYCPVCDEELISSVSADIARSTGIIKSWHQMRMDALNAHKQIARHDYNLTLWRLAEEE